jgi:hypothetical protein
MGTKRNSTLRAPKNASAGRPRTKKKVSAAPTPDPEEKPPPPRPRPRMRAPVNKYPQELTGKPIEDDLDSLYAAKDHDTEVVSATIGILGRNHTKKPTSDLCMEIDRDEEISMTIEDDCDTNSSDHHEEEGEPFSRLIKTSLTRAPFSVPVHLEFMIPVDNAMETATFDSNIGWSEFRYRVAIEMSVKKDDLKLGYKFSTAAQKELPRHLNTTAHLAAL